MKQPRKNQHHASAHGTRARSNRTWSCWTLHETEIDESAKLLGATPLSSKEKDLVAGAFKQALALAGRDYGHWLREAVQQIGG